jgi:nucleotidyltransferase substrate binding protein (TIGR01987 family)
MREHQDIRWLQRFENFEKALHRLGEVIQKAEEENLSELEQEGLLQRFEYTWEMAWLVLKDYFEMQGEVGINGARDAFRMALRRELLDEESASSLMRSIETRNMTSHGYNPENAEKAYQRIIDSHYDAFRNLQDILRQQKEEWDQ